LPQPTGVRIILELTGPYVKYLRTSLGLASDAIADIVQPSRRLGKAYETWCSLSAVDRESFGRLVAEALAHLYDGPFLQSHPLGELLVGGASEATLTGLQRLLLETVETLKPPPITAPESPNWRRYQYIRRRYVESASLDRIADELGIGERQARRYNHEGVEAIAASLWSRYCRRRLADERGPDHQPTGNAGQDALACELASMAGSEPGGPTSIAETLSSVLTTVARLLESRRVALEVSLASDLSPVAVHRVVLRQILLGVLVHLAERHAGTRARLTASNCGADVEVDVGVSQLPGRAAPRGRATPVARLAVDPAGARLDGVRRLIEFQHGTFRVVDGRAGEERLCLTLPASPVATVLLIDDNLDFRRLFQRFLEDSTYRVTYTEATDDFVAAAVEKRPDVIILDVMMPTQDGWEVLQALKRLEATRDIPVIVCSVLREPTLAIALGAASVLVKPITRAELLGALERCCPPPVPAGGPGSLASSPSPRRLKDRLGG